jgi:hypothetical protein
MNMNFRTRAESAGVGCRFIQLDGGHTIETVIAALPTVLKFVDDGISH